MIPSYSEGMAVSATAKARYTSEDFIRIFTERNWVHCGTMLRRDINDLAAQVASYGGWLRKVIKVRAPEDLSKVLVFYKDPT